VTGVEINEFFQPEVNDFHEFKQLLAVSVQLSAVSLLLALSSVDLGRLKEQRNLCFVLKPLSMV